MSLGRQDLNVTLTAQSEFGEYEFARNALLITLAPGIGTGTTLIKFASPRQMGEVARLLLDMESEAIAQGCLSIGTDMEGAA